jgi:hypothetical protein
MYYESAVRYLTLGKKSEDRDLSLPEMMLLIREWVSFSMVAPSQRIISFFLAYAHYNQLVKFKKK